MQDPIVAADPKARRQVLIALTISIVVGLIALKLLHSYLNGLLVLVGEDEEAATTQAVRLISILAALGALSFLGMGWWFWRLARRIRRSDQYPPPGAKVLRDTPLLTGPRAWTVATKAKLAAFFCSTLGVGVFWFLWSIAVSRLGR